MNSNAKSVGSGHGRAGSAGGNLALLWSEFRHVKLMSFLALCVLLLSVLATIGGPMLVQNFVDRATGSGRNAHELLRLAVVYLLVAVVGSSARVAANSLGVRTGWHVADRLRTRLLRRVLMEDAVLEVESRPVGDILERVEGSADIIGRSIAESGFRLIGNAAVVVGTLIVLLWTIPVAGLGITVLIVVTVAVLGKLSKVAVRRWKLAREVHAELFGYIGDVVAARDDLHVLDAAKFTVERSEQGLGKLFEIEGRAYIGGRAFWPVTQIFIATAFGLGFAYGLQQLELGAISVGTITAIYLYVDLLQKPLEETSSLAGQMQQMIAVLSITSQTLAPRPEQALSREELPPGPLAVSFEGVTFGYNEGAPVLQDVTFEAHAGTTLGIVGRTGAGKSTLLNLLCGIVPPTRGRVLIGGVDASRITPEVFARRVSVLSQRARVFAASVRDNVSLFSDDVTDETIYEVLGRLDAARWVRELPQGLDTLVGAGGRVLSKGEMQILTAARVMLRPGSLLIVDEATSVMDAQSERSWTELIKCASVDRTVVMVEHRQGALSEADHVIEMENGRVVGRRVGTKSHSQPNEGESQ